MQSHDFHTWISQHFKKQDVLTRNYGSYFPLNASILCGTANKNYGLKIQ